MLVCLFHLQNLGGASDDAKDDGSMSTGLINNISLISQHLLSHNPSGTHDKATQFFVISLCFAYCYGRGGIG